MRRPEPAPIGPLLRRLRTSAALSQEALAERAGLSARAVGDLERGIHHAPRLETVRLLADALNLDAQDRSALLAAARPTVVGEAASTERARPKAPLPLPLSRLIGRERELAMIDGLLTQTNARLVTLTGPGGAGKTRLAQELAATLNHSFADGVMFVDLATVRDPGLVTKAIATALSLREGGSQSVADQLVAYVRERAILLVLDNFEQILDAAPVVSDLLAIAPGLRVLATSREPLHLAGEHVMPVEPLALPVPDYTGGIDDLQRSAAMTLFVERAQAADPGFVVTSRNAVAIANIVRRLDGLPLAIELAAARVRTLTPAALLTRLEPQSLGLLTGGPRNQPDRQRTMRDAIGWSLALLLPEEQHLFRRLAIFVGGFTLEAAAMVGECSGLDLLDRVAALNDKGLVRRLEDLDDEPRFTMLETIREFGLEQLADSGEESQIRTAHAAWIVALAGQAEVELEGKDQGLCLKHLEAEHANLRAALTWLAQAGEVTAALHVASALGWFWYIHGHYREGRAWLEAALTRGDGTAISLRARALHWVSVLALCQHDFPAAQAFAEEGLAVAERIGDPRGAASARIMLGMAPLMEGNYPLAVARLDSALTHWRDLGDQYWVAMVLVQLGQAVFGLPDLDRAAALHEEALTLLSDNGGPWSRAVILGSYGNVVLAQGKLVLADELLRQSLGLRRDIDDQRFAAETLASLAIVAARQGRVRRAARLVGVVDAVCDRIRAPLMDTPAQVAHYERMIETVRAELGDETFVTAREAGRSLTLDEAIREVMDVAKRAPDDPPGPLFPT